MASLNNPSTSSQARQARGAVTINGVRVPFVSWEVNNTVHYQADTFKVVLPCQALDAIKPTPIAMATSTLYPASQANQSSVPLLVNDVTTAGLLTAGVLTMEVFAGFPANPLQFATSELTRLILGRADTLEYDPVQGAIELTGRDYTSVFIDAKTTDKWGNEKVGEIVTALATRHQMSAVVQITDDKFAGNIYKIDQVRLAMQRSEWDILTWLASETGNTVYVRGEVLYFVPAPDETKLTPYSISVTQATKDQPMRANVSSISLTRNMTIAKGITVTVSTHHPGTTKTFSASYPKAAKGIKVGNATPASGIQDYSYTIPAMTPEAALQRAQTIYKQIVAHEMTIYCTLPGDNILVPTNPVSVTGLGNAADQLYYPDSITRSMSMQDGYRMNFTAKNISQQTAAANPVAS